MNLQENINYLAQLNSRSCHPLREEEINKDLPYFEIYKNDIGRYNINCFNYESHDNADRMHLWKNYLTSSILPNIDSLADIKGYYNIQLHDSYTYLNDDKSYKNVLTFSKFKNDSEPILVPDPYMIQNYGNIMNSFEDTEDWNKKKNRICFYGTTTGNRNYENNHRINVCKWGVNNRDFCDFYITKIAQMDSNQIKPKISDILHNPVSIPEQLKYKFHMVMDGNTSRFDVWYFKGNNVIMKHDSKEMLWYYPLIQADTHFVDVNITNIKSKFEFFKNNTDHATIMIYNAKRLASNLFRPIVHQMYSINLFENIAFNK